MHKLHHNIVTYFIMMVIWEANSNTAVAECWSSCRVLSFTVLINL